MLIESAQNDTFKKILSLTVSKGLKEEGLFLLSGEKLVREFLQKPHLQIAYEILAPGYKPLTAGVNQIKFSNALFAQIDVLGTHFNILAMEQPALPIIGSEEIKTYAPKGVELVAPIGDPGNLGALIRSCEAFGIPRVILTREAAHPFLPKSVKASAGSVLRVPLARGPALSEFPASCIALDAQGTAIDNFIWPANALMVVGEEGPGLAGTNFSTHICIPTTGVESLNAVVAASIALSRLPRKK